MRLSAVMTKDKARVAITPPATMRCTTAEAIAHWVREDVTPIAAALGAPLGGIANFASYECRGRNRVVGAQISEHGKGNALDIRALTLTNGKSYELTDIAVAKDARERLKASACARFTTVLGPGLRRLPRGPRPCRPCGAAQRLPHLPMGGARHLRSRSAAARAPRRSAAARALTRIAPCPKPFSRNERTRHDPAAASARPAGRHSAAVGTARLDRVGRGRHLRMVRGAVRRHRRLSGRGATATAPGSVDMQKLANDGFLLAFITIVAAPAWIGVSALAARLRGWRVRDYLALVPPRRGEIVFGIACLAALLIGVRPADLLLGRDVVPRFMREAYMSARDGGSLPLFFIAVVIVAPISEEIAFRGFLFRGLSASWLGVSGTLVVTSAVWAAMHVQYDAFTLGQIFCIGLLLGWIRWATGSTLLTIVAARAGEPRGLHPGGDQGRVAVLGGHHARIDRRRAAQAENILQRLSRRRECAPRCAADPRSASRRARFSRVKPHGSDSAVPQDTVIA